MQPPGTHDERSSSLATYWPAAVVAAFSLVITAVQFAVFARLDAIPVGVALDTVFALILLAGVVVVQPLRTNPRIYRPLMAGTTLVHVFAVTEILDEVVAQPFWFDLVFGDVPAPLGALCLLLGLHRWVAIQAAQRRELEAQTEELTRRAERLDQFASVVSHDLRNPLSLAEARLRLVRDDPESADDHLDVIAGALDRMETIVEDTLTLAREGRTVTDPEPVDLPQVVRESWQTATVSTDTPTLDLALDDERVSADPARLHQLLENLFENAVQHAGPDVTVRVGALAAGEGFFVADDGPGIPAGDRADVFDAGYTDAEDGTGFGLAIVRELAEAHGWTVDLTESDTGGARFEFRNVDHPGE